MQTLGIDFGGTTIKMGVCAGADITQKLDPIQTEDSDTPEAFVELVRKQVGSLSQAGSKVSAIGVGVPGFADWETGCTFGLTNVEGWENIPLRDRLQEATGIPVIVDNDANAMTYATFEPYIPLAIGYLILTVPLAILSHRMEKRFCYEH